MEVSSLVPAVLALYPESVRGPFQTVDSGLVNATFLLPSSPEPCVLQRLHPVFHGPSLMEDVDRITTALHQMGRVGPQVISSQTGEKAVWEGGGWWRMLTYVPGVTFTRFPSHDAVFRAASLTARFHGDLTWEHRPFAHHLPGFHDTTSILHQLVRVTTTASGSHASTVRALASSIKAAVGELPLTWPGQPRRVIHGDLKASNVRFDEAGREAVCLLDLDTLMHAPLAVEMGDAARSWCNPAGEDEGLASVDLQAFQALAEGYAQGASPEISRDERRSFADGMAVIALELAARFTIDVVEDRYFGWNPSLFESRSHHNLARARTQLALGRDAVARREDLLRFLTP